MFSLLGRANALALCEQLGQVLSRTRFDPKDASASFFMFDEWSKIYTATKQKEGL